MLHLDIHSNLKQENTFPLNISIHLPQGEFAAIYGASGSGKTTILRVLAGFNRNYLTTISFNEQQWQNDEKRFFLPVQQREIGFVFQDTAMFPHLSVEENIAFACKDKSLMLDLMRKSDLLSLAKQKSNELSGGQKQRVALCRALSAKPKLLLLDEPFAALDDSSRFMLQDVLQHYHQKFEPTVLMVSHNIPEIFKLCSRVYHIEQGTCVKTGSAEFVFSQQKISGKFNLSGEIYSIESSGVLYVVSVISGNNLVKVVADEDEVKNLFPGKKVLLSSKAFNPLIIPL